MARKDLRRWRGSRARLQSQSSTPVASSYGAFVADSFPLLEVRNLRTYFDTDDGVAKAVDGVSFAVRPGQTVALVGESGCGKTVTALSILQLIPMPPGRIVEGQILLAGQDLVPLTARQLQPIRGGRIAMIFQEPGTSLNPVFTIGDQIAEAIRLHRKVSRAQARQEVLQVLNEVRMSDPERRLSQYPHELSGGMKQRAMIAMALACRPQLLIADEPTTALDVTIQARILELLRKTQADRGMAVLLITHDLGVVAEMADEVVVMYAGKVVEHAAAQDLFARPSHPYTQGLFASLPRVDRQDDRLVAIEGNVPLPTRFPTGCRFRGRCPLAEAKCEQEPPLAEVGPGHRSACWFASDLYAGRRTATRTANATSTAAPAAMQ
ncbi:MAG: ABC transporter ATP-binding protein [Pirellulales bacterium]|nr:ABC transporter ATP-binding protein [Pirellulales bacterium]